MAAISLTYLLGIGFYGQWPSGATDSLSWNYTSLFRSAGLYVSPRLCFTIFIAIVDISCVVLVKLLKASPFPAALWATYWIVNYTSISLYVKPYNLVSVCAHLLRAFMHSLAVQELDL